MSDEPAAEIAPHNRASAKAEAAANRPWIEYLGMPTLTLILFAGACAGRSHPC